MKTERAILERLDEILRSGGIREKILPIIREQLAAERSSRRGGLQTALSLVRRFGNRRSLGYKKRNERRISAVSPLTPRSSALRTSRPNEVPRIRMVTPFFLPAGWTTMVLPQIMVWPGSLKSAWKRAARLLTPPTVSGCLFNSL